MNLIQSTIEAYLPSKRKSTPSGWISFNAVCCHHRGEKSDTRKRGGIMFSNEGFQYHCFNCNFKAGWTPGRPLSKNAKFLMGWIGVPEDEIAKLNFEALRTKEETSKQSPSINLNLDPVEMPKNCKPILDWLKNDPSDDLLNVVDYLLDRGMELNWYNWHWSPEPGYSDRVIIPFYDNGKIVGWTGRKITKGKPKYLTKAQPGYVFNIDQQSTEREYVIVTEGQFDAISIGCVAILHNEPNETQIFRINRLGKKVIVVPDRDKPGAKLIDAALKNNWAVSLPFWEEDIKDCADAVLRYGRLYTLFTILQYKETNEVKIQLLKKKLENKE
jgi:hypothetical protein